MKEELIIIPKRSRLAILCMTTWGDTTFTQRRPAKAKPGLHTFFGISPRKARQSRLNSQALGMDTDTSCLKPGHRFIVGRENIGLEHERQVQKMKDAFTSKVLAISRNELVLGGVVSLAPR